MAGLLTGRRAAVSYCRLWAGRSGGLVMWWRQDTRHMQGGGCAWPPRGEGVMGRSEVRSRVIHTQILNGDHLRTSSPACALQLSEDLFADP
jgi:hypothetical protein